jgi:hypothetical protein
MVPNFLSAASYGEAFHGLRFHDIKSLILVDALFLLEGRRKREGEKKEKEKQITVGEEGFPWLNPPCWLCSRLQL